MPVIRSQIDIRSPNFRENAAHMETLVTDLRNQVEAVKTGGGERSQKRHLDRGKLLPRDRINTLIDPGAPWLEFSQLAAHGMYDGEAPSSGVLTGIGRVAGE